ncbi:MAG: ROK family protein [Lentisphaeraceae bacterium]|nr:ROK family protein [Lentisphaeraceae bacterium]
MLLAGIDIGGTKMEVSLFEVEESLSNKEFDLFLSNNRLGARKVLSKRIPTERHLGYENVVGRLVDLIQDTLKEAGFTLEALNSIGIGLPGIVNPKTGRMSNGNTGIFIEKDLIGDLKAGLSSDLPITVANDANCFALAEAVAGAGVKYHEETGVPIKDHVGIGVIIGTGCGGGIVIGSRLVVGKNGAGGEVGHYTLVKDGHPCFCGKNGCAEQYLSGVAIEAAYASRIYSQIAERPNSRKIFEMAEDQEPLAKAIVKQYKKDLGAFIANMSNVLDADYFVLGGGVSLQPAIYEDLEDIIRRETYTPGYSPRVYQHVLGDSAGGLGAAILPVV